MQLWYDTVFSFEYTTHLAPSAWQWQACWAPRAWRRSPCPPGRSSRPSRETSCSASSSWQSRRGSSASPSSFPPPPRPSLLQGLTTRQIHTTIFLTTLFSKTVISLKSLHGKRVTSVKCHVFAAFPVLTLHSCCCRWWRPCSAHAL